jgi:hypothetical protein
MGEDG